MPDTKLETLLAVVKHQSFTRAAEELALTQPAVSHQIRQLEAEIGYPLLIRSKTGLKVTQQGEIVVKYARRQVALHSKMMAELQNADTHPSVLRIGITHTSESNRTAAVLAKYSSKNSGTKIILFTDTINNLYDMLENYEIDLAIIEGSSQNPAFSSVLLGTDCLMCVLSNDNPLARQHVVTLAQLKRQKMILRTPSSATRMLFESALENNLESIDNFNVTLEVDNIATIKDLIRRNLGVSILPRSACLDELRKGKLTALPIENLSMTRETKLLYNRDFSNADVLNDIVSTYAATDA